MFKDWNFDDWLNHILFFFSPYCYYFTRSSLFRIYNVNIHFYRKIIVIQNL